MKRRGMIARTAGLALFAAKLGVDALGVKKATEIIEERRRPHRSAWARLAKPALALGVVGGGAAYAARSGLLSDMMQRVSDALSSSGSEAVPATPPGSHNGSEIEIDLTEARAERT
jgi:hypothetical protein